jgi:hypothetical protein
VLDQSKLVKEGFINSAILEKHKSVNLIISETIVTNEYPREDTK